MPGFGAAVGRVARCLVVACVAAGALAPAGARAWWDDAWSGRKQLRLDTSASGANVTEPIGPSAVLVRLHLGNFRFDAAAENGADLRFVAQDDKTVLPHHIERYDALLGEALVWVGLTELKPGSQTLLWLYYGNETAPKAEDVKATYDPAAVLVYHFGEQNEPPRDSTANGNQATTAAAFADGTIIARGLRLDGAATVGLPSTPSLAWAEGGPATISFWMKPADADSTGVIYSRVRDGRGLVIGLEGGKPFAEVVGPAGAQRALATAILPAGGWHHLAVAAGKELTLYLDGVPTAKVTAALPALDVAALLGGEPAPAAVAPAPGARPTPARAARPGFRGELDELQLARVERTPGFVRAAAISQGPDPAKFLVAGQDEESGSFQGGYFGILIGSVTLDGWVVIGILALMSAVSIWVMVEKAGYLSATEQGNGRFQKAYAAVPDLAALIAGANAERSALGEPKLLRASSLNRMFLVASAEVRKRTARRPWLSAEAIESIRASLDAALVRENQRLSRLMVLLTIAISGGPFLGLLGTVVGVMITFAAIAAAGDVNVNAIAPGIAAALVATVAGLAVAIPALFAYNWLLTRSRDVTATMQVFVDELVTRLAETYAAEEPAHDERHRRPSIVAAE